MALTDENGMNTTMLVSPAGGAPYYGGNGGGFGNFGGDNGWWIILLLLLVAGGWNNGGGFGGNGGAMPYIMNTGDNVQRGFDQSAIMNGLGDISGNLYGLQNSICQGFAGVNAGIASGFAQAEIAENARQMANMNQLFGLSQQFANCCCENRLGISNLQSTIMAENCADRAAISDGIRDVITNQTNNTQRILDQLCADKIDAKNEKIADLERQLTMANLQASQTAQTAQILADNGRQTTALEQYLNPVPIPAYLVQNPNCCNQNPCGCNTGCGCGA